MDPTRGGSADPFELAVTLRDPFEGGFLLELFESRRIPVVHRHPHHSFSEVLAPVVSHGEILVPRSRLADAQQLVRTFRDEVGDARAPPRIAKRRARFFSVTDGGPQVVSPFGNLGWLEVDTERLEAGRPVEGAFASAARLAITAVLQLVVEAGGERHVVDEATFDIQESDAAHPFSLNLGPRSEVAARCRLEARLYGRRHPLGEASLVLGELPAE